MRTPRLGQALHQAAQVVEVPRQAVHAVHHHRVALAHEGEQPFQLGALGVLAACLVGEHLVHLDVFELPFRVLVEAADADVADALTVQDASRMACVRKKSMTLDGAVSINSGCDSILTFLQPGC